MNTLPKTAKLSSYDLRRIQDSTNYAQFTLDVETVDVILNRILPCAAEYDSTSILATINFSIDDMGNFEAVATDGSRMALFSDYMPGYANLPTNLPFSFMVAAAQLRLLETIWNKRKNRAPVTIRLENGEISITVFGRSEIAPVVAKRVEGIYPRYQELFPPDKDLPNSADLDSQLIIDHASIIAAASRAEDKCWKSESIDKHKPIFKNDAEAPELNRKLRSAVKLNFDNADGVSVSATSQFLNYRANIGGNCSSAVKEIAINAGFLIDVLSNSTRLSHVKFSTALKPMVFFDNDKRVKTLIMPIAIK